MDSTLLDKGFTPQPLSAKQYQELDDNGFTILENVIDAAWLHQLRERFEDLVKAEGERGGIEAGQMKGVRRLADLVNKGEVFDDIYIHPSLLTAALHIFQQPFKLGSLNGHDPHTLPFNRHLTITIQFNPIALLCQNHPSCIM